VIWQYQIFNSTKTHFFLTSKIKTDYNYFDTSDLDIKIQSVSDEKYLKKFDIKSPIINSQSVLHSMLDFNGNRDDLDFSVSAEMYEDLTKKTQVIDMSLYYLTIL
jgi:LPS-assembly protein